MGRRTMYWAAVLTAAVLLLPACAQGEEQALTPTGYPSDEVQFRCVMVGGRLYKYDAYGWDRVIPEDYAEVGQVESEDVSALPEEDFSAARTEVGALIYQKDGYEDDIYVKESDGSVWRYKLQ